MASEVHAALDYHADLIHLEAPAVEPVFDELVLTARKE